MTTTMGAVTLYNASFEPLGRVSFKHAVRMLFREVAVVHEQQGDKMIGPHPWPKAVRLVRYIAMHWMYRPAGYSREGVLKRDQHRCAYYGRKGNRTPEEAHMVLRIEPYVPTRAQLAAIV
jgi:hypothetical protein